MGQQPSIPSIPQPATIECLLKDVQIANKLASRLHKEGIRLNFQVLNAKAVDVGFNARLFATICVSKVPVNSKTSERGKPWKILTCRQFYSVYHMIHLHSEADEDEDMDMLDTPTTATTINLDDGITIPKSDNNNNNNNDETSSSSLAAAMSSSSSNNNNNNDNTTRSRSLSMGSTTEEEQGECPICFEPVKNGLSLPCTHGPFCQSCISAWSVGHQSCPVCRRTVAADSIDCWVHLDAPSSEDMVDSLFSFIEKIHSSS